MPPNNAPKLQNLNVQTETYAQEVINGGRDWARERISIQQQIVQLTNQLIEAANEEGQHMGFTKGDARGKGWARDKNRDANRQQAEDNKRLSEQNALLNKELNALSQYVLELVTINEQTRKIIRREMRADSTFDYKKLPRLKPRTMLIPKYLGNDIHIERVSRRIEELLADHQGKASQEYLYDLLAPEYPASAINYSLTHLSLSERIELDENREWKLIRQRARAK